MKSTSSLPMILRRIKQRKKHNTSIPLCMNHGIRYIGPVNVVGDYNNYYYTTRYRIKCTLSSTGRDPNVFPDDR